MRPFALLARLAALLLVSALSLQLYFLLRIALMAVVDPQSTTFQRSEIWRLLGAPGRWHWSQQWVPAERMSPRLARAVIASEDAGFVEHSGVEWDALERAWERNQRSELRAERVNGRAERRGRPARVEAKLVGGSTITQQLAKNLFLSGERHLARKGQELVIAMMLEALLSKQRILEIYLNNVEWGEGVFGAEAAARHYFHVGTGQLGALQAARLAVMLPAPKRFEKRPDSPYIAGRAAVIAARMGDVEAP
ncbi:MAG TPA: transglycosylase domain-containing protein [Ideonella sp.]|nr:transglycosylase domain-containing protein [Ideonella sp.]